MYIFVPEVFAPKLVTCVMAWAARLRGAVGVINSPKLTGELTAVAASRLAPNRVEKSFMVDGGCSWGLLLDVVTLIGSEKASTGAGIQLRITVDYLATLVIIYLLLHLLYQL